MLGIDHLDQSVFFFSSTLLILAYQAWERVFTESDTACWSSGWLFGNVSGDRELFAIAPREWGAL